MKEYEKEKKELRKLIADNDYKIMVINTSIGQCWDKADTKVFALIVGKTQLNPTYLKNIGWDRHYRKSAAENCLFYDSVLGMSRAFNIVYNLSSWLFDDGYKIKQI